MKYLSLLFLLSLFLNCNLVNDMKKGLNVTSELCKKYDCLENNYAQNTENGKTILTISFKCEDQTGLYLGKVVLEYHKAMKKSGIFADEYKIVNSIVSEEKFMSASDLDKAIALEKKVEEIKNSITTKQFEKFKTFATDSLNFSITKTNFFKVNDSIIQSNYPLNTGFDCKEGFAFYGFEQTEKHFLILGIQISTGKVNLIRFN